MTKTESSESIEALAARLAESDPGDIIEHALGVNGPDVPISFSGAEDVVLVDMARRTGLPFRVFTLDTGRLHPETYRFLDRVRVHFAE